MSIDLDKIFSGDNRGPWCQVNSGIMFYPFNPRVEDVNIGDIAHSLAHQCRFAGHCDEFYSVAQHSVLVSYHCEDARWGLMHDASEAYLMDLPRPIKGTMPDYRKMEGRLDSVIAEKFNLLEEMPEDVKTIDLRLLATEKKFLMKNSKDNWDSLLGVEPLDIIIKPYGPNVAKELFLSRFRELFLDDNGGVR